LTRDSGHRLKKRNIKEGGGTGRPFGKLAWGEGGCLLLRKLGAILKPENMKKSVNRKVMGKGRGPPGAFITLS